MNAIHTESVQGEAVEEDISFASADHLLKGKLFRPSGEPDAIVIMNGATGVPARFYRAFARWLADEKGFACLTYDYRDFGASAVQGLRASNATMADWGVDDQQAARDFAVSQFPDAPVWVIGHSLGALCLSFQKNPEQISRIIAVASGPVNVRDHPWPYQALARLFWFGHAPLTTLIAGFLPGKILGLGSDLPAGVYWQWRRWCTQSDFFKGDIGTKLPHPDWSGIKAEMKFVAMSDDVMMPPLAVWKLMEFYPEAQRTQLVLDPKDFDLKELGHIGVFAEKNRVVWDTILA